MLRMIVLGAAGRMGRRVVALSEDLDVFEVVGAVIRPDDPRIGDDAGLVAGTNVLGVPLTSDVPDVEADVAVDFSSPGGTRRLVPQLRDRGVGVVVATTGLDAETRALLVDAARRIPVLVAPNLSVGIALLSALVEQASRALGLEADVELVETHHRNKRDAPSGTALHLAERVAAARGQNLEEVAIYGRRAGGGERVRRGEEIAIHALRTGDVVGEHTVSFGFGSERLELTHRAHSRGVFARGAVRAAQFLSGANPGLYGMGDLLKRALPSIET